MTVLDKEIVDDYIRKCNSDFDSSSYSCYRTQSCEKTDWDNSTLFGRIPVDEVCSTNCNVRYS